MKLKYYMRGLGIGIILTTLILIIANPKEKLSDSEIKERAKALGMVEAEDQDDISLSEVLENSKLTITPQVTPTLAPTPEPTKAPEPTQTPIPTPTITPKPTEAPVVEVPDNESRDGENKGELVTFSVDPGMSSGKVAAMLVEKGLIKNAEDFNQFIVKEGKASVIRVGTYTLPKGASYKDIVTKITTK